MGLGLELGSEDKVGVMVITWVGSELGLYILQQYCTISQNFIHSALHRCSMGTTLRFIYSLQLGLGLGLALGSRLWFYLQKYCTVPGILCSPHLYSAFCNSALYT